MSEPAPGTLPRGIADQRDPARRGGMREWWRRLRKARSGDSVRDTLEELIEQREETATPIDSAERALIENTLKLRDVTVDDVSVPRAHVVAVEEAASLDDVIALMNRTHHSRLPVYRQTLDEVVGMVHVKDVLPHAGRNSPVPLSSIMRKVLFVAPSMRLLDLLLQMRLMRIHLAVVVDEYGGVDGLVTIEDLVEEIVGDIEDEHDLIEGPRIVTRTDGSLVADGRATVEEFEANVGPVLSDAERDEIDTLNGLIVSLTGRVPERGERIPHPSGVELEVLDADPRRVKRVRIRNVPAAQ